jgi:hypothetical protein
VNTLVTDPISKTVSPLTSGRSERPLVPRATTRRPAGDTMPTTIPALLNVDAPDENVANTVVGRQRRQGLGRSSSSGNRHTYRDDRSCRCGRRHGVFLHGA